MSIPPDLITLKPEDILITSVPRNSSWLVVVQRGSPVEKTLLAYLEKVRALPKGAQPPPIDPIGLAGVGCFDLADKAFLVVVKAGQEGKGGPNDTEFALMKLINAHGRKVRREAANG